MLKLIQKTIDIYEGISAKATNKINELRNSKDKDVMLISYWSGVKNVTRMFIKDLETIRTNFEMSYQNIDAELNNLRGK